MLLPTAGSPQVRMQWQLLLCTLTPASVYPAGPQLPEVQAAGWE